jgi:glycerol kinase
MGKYQVKKEDANASQWVQKNVYPEISKKAASELFSKWKLAVSKSRNWIN